MPRHYSPLRYPGGKQKLTPFVIEILEENEINGKYAEPYAGGAGVAIELLISGRIKNIYLNDKDYGVYCFWYSVKNFNEDFCKKIEKVKLTISEWKRQREVFRNQRSYTAFEVGFSFFYLNRCNRSGVLTGGVIGGMNQKGNYKIDARFNRLELIRRISILGEFSSSIKISNLDARTFITKYKHTFLNNALIYLDPPYYVKGQGLYLNHYGHDDHVHLCNHLTKHLERHNWILSYDAVTPIVDLYNDRPRFVYDLKYSAAEPRKGSEIFIFSDMLSIPAESRLPYINQGLEYIEY